ncbi:UNVERIFIED_CONTAM: cytochrome [Sesamum latifolium]|uniref:Cytochrome n=1 Tax=Sesamum latifolium TaxID=2727402 RepID=A0AAW2XGC5_9LAMI
MAEVREYLIFLIIGLISAILLRAFVKSSPRLPPSPLALPIIGHLHLIGPIAHQSFAKLSSRYGPLIHLYLVVSNNTTYGSKDFTFAPYGDYWRFVKKLCMSQLLGGQTLDLLPVRRDEIKYLIDFLLVKANAGESVDMGREFMRMANNLISTMVMSRRCSEDEKEAGEVRRLVEDITELTGKFNLSDYIWFCKNLDLQGFRKRSNVLAGRLDGMLEKIIDEHQDERRKLKQTRPVLGGSDTSALSLEWGLAELINHPNVLRKAVEEIDSVVGKGRIVQESDIPRLPYLQAIVKEILRLHPPAPLIPRESTEDCTISGYHIPAKTRVFISAWALGRDPNYWKGPLEFRPESGRRGCPGTSLALLLVQTTLAAMIQCFEWKVEGGNGTVDMEEGPGVTLPKAHHLVCSPVVRLDPFPPM